MPLTFQPARFMVKLLRLGRTLLLEMVLAKRPFMELFEISRSQLPLQIAVMKLGRTNGGQLKRGLTLARGYCFKHAPNGVLAK